MDLKPSFMYDLDLNSSTTTFKIWNWLQNSLNHGCMYDTTSNSNIDNENHAQNVETTQDYAYM